MKIFTLIIVALTLALSSAFASDCNHDDCDGVNPCDDCTCEETVEDCSGNCCDCDAEECDEECECECDDCDHITEETEGHDCDGCNGSGEC